MSGSVFVILHVIANVIWIGSILAVAVVSASPDGSVVVRGQLALEVYKRLATPAFIASFVFGVARLALDTHYYFVQTKFMHAKLLLALVVIALHHVIGARAKRTANGVAQDVRITLRLAFVLVFAAAGAIFLARYLEAVLSSPFGFE